MAVHKVPGSKQYMADDSGFKEILSSAKMGAVVLAAADDLADQAGPSYRASASTVHAGWANEARAGAVVRQVSASASDARNRALVAATEAMGRRGHV